MQKPGSLPTRDGAHTACTAADLYKEGGNDVLGIDHSWDAQVLDAVLVEDGGSRLEPRNVLCAVQELWHDDACAHAHECEQLLQVSAFL